MELDTFEVERESFHMAQQGKGEWLTRQMERENVSVRLVAEALGVTTKTVYDWQGGKTAISEERIPRLAEVLGVSELQARRGLGFWVPDESAAAHAGREDEIDAALEVMRAAIAELERIKRSRNAS
jgi:transcriptional regulator with XRE-family HTH domain